ncbi:MAG: ABC transporter permease [Halobacteriota archaeon]
MSVKSLNQRLSESTLGKFTLWGSARGFGILVAFLLWTSMAAAFPRELLPGPIETLQLSWSIIHTGAAWIQLSATFTAIILAFSGALVLGSTLGILMGTSRFGLNFFTPYVNIGLSTPGLAWAATFFIIFGYDTLFGVAETAPVIAGILTVAPYLAINIWKGVENIQQDLVEMAVAFDVSRMRMLRRVVLPNVAPELFAAFRFGIAISWKVITVAEMFAAKAGIGFKLMQQYQLYRYEEAWAWAATFIIMILVIEYGFFKPIEDRVFEYRNDAELHRIGE